MSYDPYRQSIGVVTQSVDDAVYSNNRKIAIGNNAFLTDGGAGSTITTQVNTSTTITSVTTLTAASNTFISASDAGGSYAVNLPAASSSTSKKFAIKKTNSSANTITVTPNGGDTIDGASTFALSKQYSWLVIQSDGTGVWKVLDQVSPAISAQYLTLATDPSLTAERVFTPGNNLTGTDGGAGNAYTLQAWVHNLNISTTTLAASSTTVQLCSAGNAAFTVNLPDTHTAANADKAFIFKKTDSTANAITISASGAQLIDGAGTYSLPTQYAWVMLYCDATTFNWDIFSSSAGNFAPLTGNFVTATSNGTLSNGRVLTSGKNTFVTDNGAGSTIVVEAGTLSSITGTTSLTATSNTAQMCSAAGGAFTVTLPAATSIPKMFHIKKTDSSANAVTISRAGSDLIDGQTTVSLSVQYQSYTIICDNATNWNII